MSSFARPKQGWRATLFTGRHPPPSGWEGRSRFGVQAPTEVLHSFLNAFEKQRKTRNDKREGGQPKAPRTHCQASTARPTDPRQRPRATPQQRAAATTRRKTCLAKLLMLFRMLKNRAYLVRAMAGVAVDFSASERREKEVVGGRGAKSRNVAFSASVSAP